MEILENINVKVKIAPIISGLSVNERVLQMKIYAANTAWVKTRQEELLTMLDRERRERVKSLKRPKDRVQGICAGLLLRHVFLEQGYSEEEWEQVEVVCGDYGKPTLKGYPEFCYSLSHSGDWVVCVVDKAPVGIDIQEMKEVKLKIAKRFFHKKEYERLSKIEELEKQRKEFYAMWAAKESYVKLTGRGIGEGIEQFVVEESYQQMQNEQGERLADIKIYETIPDYIVCVCTDKGDKPVQLDIVEEIQR